MTAPESAAAEIEKLERELENRRRQITQLSSRCEVIEVQLKSLRPLAAKAEKPAEAPAK